MMGLLGLPWAAAAIYAGWAKLYWFAGSLVLIGTLLYFLLKGAAIIRHIQRSPLQLIIGTIVSQAIMVSILFGIGTGAAAILK